MTEWDGRPQNPERDGWHWLMLDALLYPARWDAAASAWHRSRFLTPAEIARLNDYCGPCLTPTEIERLRAEIVLLEATGAEAADEIERLRAKVHTLSTTCGHCGDLERAWAEAATARRKGIEEAASIADGRPSDRGEDVAAAIRALLTEGGR